MRKTLILGKINLQVSAFDFTIINSSRSIITIFINLFLNAELRTKT